jgi:hypothetical protein
VIERWSVFRLVNRWYRCRPFLTSWVLLATGMVVLMTLFAFDAGLTLRQHVTLAVITVGLAWLCVWIISLEDREHQSEEPEERVP